MNPEKKYKRIGWVRIWRLRRGRKWKLMPNRIIYETKADAIACYEQDIHNFNQRDRIWRLKPVYVEVLDES